MVSEESKGFSFSIAFRKNKWQDFQKSVKHPTFEPYLANIWTKMNFQKNRVRQFSEYLA